MRSVAAGGADELRRGPTMHRPGYFLGTAPILLQGPPPLDTLPRCSALSWGWWWGSSVRAHRSWQRTSFSDSNWRLRRVGCRLGGSSRVVDAFQIEFWPRTGDIPVTCTAVATLHSGFRTWRICGSP